MEKSYSDSAKNVLEIAKEQAQNFHHRIIGTEHVLLALVIEANGDAGKLLRERNVTPTLVREEILAMVQVQRPHIWKCPHA